MDGQKKNTNISSQASVNKYGVSGRGVFSLIKELMEANSTASDVLIIKKLNAGINDAFSLVKEKEFKMAEIAFDQISVKIIDSFNQYSFQYYCCELLYLPGYAYLEYKKGKKDEAISLTRKSIEYAIILQSYPSSDNIALYISQMLDNLARLYLVCNEMDEWKEVVLENIHFLANGHCPAHCENFIAPHNFNTNPLRYVMLTGVLNNTILSIVKHKLTAAYKLFDSIALEDASQPLMAQIYNWVKLNRLLTQQKAGSELFETTLNEFLAYKNSEYSDLKILKLFIKSRISKEKVQLYSHRKLIAFV